MKWIRLFNGEGVYAFQSLVNLSEFHIKQAKENKNYLHENVSPKWLLSELFCILKKKGEIPELTRERKLELWREAEKDRLLYLSLYLIDVI